jgi:hypothetical protein
MEDVTQKFFSMQPFSSIATAEEVGYIIYRQRFTPYFQSKPEPPPKNPLFSHPPTMPKYELIDNFVVSPFGTENWFPLYIQAIVEFTVEFGMSNKLASQLLLTSARFCRTVRPHKRARPADVLYQIFVLSFIYAFHELNPAVSMDKWAQVSDYSKLTLTSVYPHFERIVRERDLVDLVTPEAVPPILEVFNTYKQLHHTNVHHGVIRCASPGHHIVLNFDFQFVGTLLYMLSTRITISNPRYYMQRIYTTRGIETKPPVFAVLLPPLNAAPWYPEFVGMVFNCLWSLNLDSNIWFVAIILVARYLTNVANYTQYGQHRLLYQLFICGLLVAQQTHSSDSADYAEWSKRTGFSAGDLQRMEIDFLNRLNWWTDITAKEFKSFKGPAKRFKYFRLELAEEAILNPSKMDLLRHIHHKLENRFFDALIGSHLYKRYPKDIVEINLPYLLEKTPIPEIINPKVVLFFWNYPFDLKEAELLGYHAKTRANESFFLIKMDETIYGHDILKGSKLAFPENVIVVPKLTPALKILTEKLDLSNRSHVFYAHDQIICFHRQLFGTEDSSSYPNFISTTPYLKHEWSSPAVDKSLDVRTMLQEAGCRIPREKSDIIVVRISRSIGNEWKEFKRISEKYESIMCVSAQMSDGAPCVYPLEKSIQNLYDESGMFKNLWIATEYYCLPCYVLFVKSCIRFVGNYHGTEQVLKRLFVKEE